MRDLLRRHPKTTIIWAHTGLGRVSSRSQPQASADSAERIPSHLDIMEELLDDPRCARLFRHLLGRGRQICRRLARSIKRMAYFINRHPDRFLFGTDNVAPKDQATQLRVFDMWKPVLALLTPAAAQVRRATTSACSMSRGPVRAWEAANVK